MSPLHHIWVTEDADPQEYVFVLHGILGSGQNFRGLAQRLASAHPQQALALVDLRFHGRSGPRPGPQTLRAAAEDLVELEQSLPGRCVAAMGHSFGGKVATVYATLREHTLDRLWVLDSPSGAREGGEGSEATLRVLDLLERAPRRWPDRRAFVDHCVQHGQPRAVGQWLAMNLSRDGEGFELDLDVPAIRALLDDYFETDLWPFLERTSLPTSLVRGGQSDVWDADAWAKADALAEARPHVQLHTVPDAGHWLHVDNPEGTLDAIARDWPTPQ